MRQRIIIAIALANNPKLIIADEPTTALDVTIQAQVLDLIREMKEKMNSSVIMITHDLAWVAGSLRPDPYYVRRERSWNPAAIGRSSTIRSTPIPGGFYSVSTIRKRRRS